MNTPNYTHLIGKDLTTVLHSKNYWEDVAERLKKDLAIAQAHIDELNSIVPLSTVDVVEEDEFDHPF